MKFTEYRHTVLCVRVCVCVCVQKVDVWSAKSTVHSVLRRYINSLHYYYYYYYYIEHLMYNVPVFCNPKALGCDQVILIFMTCFIHTMKHAEQQIYKFSIYTKVHMNIIH